ncbi:MAG: hypothetical protein V4568_09685 [Pseudomonadota bacterium]
MSRKRSKQLEKALRQFAGIAYERELATATHALQSEFVRWERKEIDVFELNDKIHEFHHGISRTLYGRYVGMDAAFGVASALHLGILNREEVGEAVFLSVEGMVLSLASMAKNDGEA